MPVNEIIKNPNETIIIEDEEMHGYLKESLIISKENSSKSHPNKENEELDCVPAILPKPSSGDLLAKSSDDISKCSEKSAFTLGNTKAAELEKVKQITPDLITKGKKILLRVKEGEPSKASFKYDINPGGCAQSKRLIKDGIIYFGPPYVFFRVRLTVKESKM